MWGAFLHHVGNLSGEKNHLLQRKTTRQSFRGVLCRPKGTGSKPRSCASVAGRTDPSNNGK